MYEISRLQLASVAEQDGLSLVWSQKPEDMFSRDVAQMICRSRMMSWTLWKSEAYPESCSSGPSSIERRLFRAHASNDIL